MGYPSTSWKIVVAGVFIWVERAGNIELGWGVNKSLRVLSPAGHKHLTLHWKMERVARATHASSNSAIPSPNPSAEKLGDVDSFGLATNAKTSHQ